jgi:hypothetical protein
MATAPSSIIGTADGSGTTLPSNENAMLNVGIVAVGEPTISVPMRNQSGARFSLRIQACRSGGGNEVVPGPAIGFGADSHRKFPSDKCTCGTKK